MMKKKLKYCGIAILVFFAFFLIQAIVSGVFAFADAIVVLQRNPELSSEEYAEATANLIESQSSVMTMVADLCIILFAFLAFGLGGKKFNQQVGLLKTKPIYIPLSILLGLSANILLCLVIEILPIPEEIINNYIEQSSGIDTNVTLINLLSTMVIAPIAEEIIFRGLIFTRFSKAFGVVAGSLMSSVLFGIAHGNLLWAIYAGLFGVLLSWVFYLTRSLYASICVHMAFNSVSFFLSGINAFLVVMSFVIFFVCLTAIILIPKIRQENHL